MDIKVIHGFILFVLDKDQDDLVSHERIDDVLHSAQMARFSECLPGNIGVTPRNQVPYGTTVNSIDYLAPFKHKVDFNQNDTPGGLLSMKTDYAHLAGIYTMNYNNKHERVGYPGVAIIDENQLATRLNSQVIYPTCSAPVGVMVYDTVQKIQIYPMKPCMGHYYYFAKPTKPEYAYTTDGRTEIYDPENSTQLLWDDENVNIIIYKVLELLGIKLQFPLVTQWAQYKEQAQS